MRKLFLLSLLAALGMAAGVNAAEVKIIANPSVKTSEISRDDLSRIFLMMKSSLEGTSHVEPVLERDGTAHEVFLKEYIGRSNSALTTYYRSLVFTGKASIPKSFASEANLVAYVAKTKGAIGYVSINTPTSGVKTLSVK